MTKKETNLLESFIHDFEQKEVERKKLRVKIVKSLERIEGEMYDDTDSSNEGLLTRVNSLEEAHAKVAQQQTFWRWLWIGVISLLTTIAAIWKAR